MLVETYELEEVKGEAEQMVADHEAIELIEKLGLEGQKSLSNKDTTTRMPYPEMTGDQEFVYSTLFPTKTDVENYSAGIIPIRVLQVVAFLKQNNFFKKIRIWHSTGRKDKDPVLVGYGIDPDASWRDKLFLLARWGDALLPFEELMRQAKIIAFADLKTKTSKAIAECSTFNAQLEALKDPQSATVELLQKNPYMTGV